MMSMFGLFSDMVETIDESVSVDLLCNHLTKQAYPWVIHWRNVRYHITKVGFHHTIRDGRTLFHVFSVTDGTTSFHLRLNTDTLGWKLLAVEHE